MLLFHCSFKEPDRQQLGSCLDKNGNVHINSKLNSAFSTIGKATADKITAKLVGKLTLSLLREFNKSYCDKKKIECGLAWYIVF